MPNTAPGLMPNRRAMSRQLVLERTKQLRGTGRQELFVFSHRFVFATAITTTHVFNVGAEAAYYWTGFGAWATAVAPGSGNTLETAFVRFRSTGSGRNHESEEVLLINMLGTIGVPMELSIATLFDPTSNIEVSIRSLAAVNTVDVALFGFKWYPQ